MIMSFRRCASLALTAILSLALAGPAAAVDFSGKRIEVLVPYSAGGGTDVYARFLAPLLAEELPGKPTIIIRNVSGAGAIAGSNQFQHRASPDGTDLYALASSGALNFVFRDPRVQYRLDKWIPIISSPTGTVIYARPELGLHEPGGWRNPEGTTLRMGANNPTGGDLRALLTLDLLGLEVIPTFGLNRGAIHAGFQRGEFNINFDTTATYHAQVVDMVKADAAVPLLSLGVIDEAGKLVRDPAVPELPTFVEVYRQVHGKDPEGPAFRAWRAVHGLNVMASKALMLPEGTPQEIVDVYDAVIKRVLARVEQDPKLRETAKEVLGLGDYPQVTDDAARTVLREALVFDDEAFKWLSQWLQEKYQVSLASAD